MRRTWKDSTHPPRAAPRPIPSRTLAWALAWAAAWLCAPHGAAPAGARDRVDLILLAHGDRVTGEIIRLESATLSVRTRTLGTVDVDWPDVVALVSPQSFLVERTDGERLTGTFAESGRPGELAVRSGSGATTAIPLADVVGIDQVGANLWNSRRGYVDAGWSFAQARHDSSFSLGAELTLRPRRFRWRNTLASTITDDDASDRSERHVVESSVELPLGRRYLGLGTGSWERNDDLGLDARTTAAAVFAWLPVNRARARLLVGPGVAESHERYVSGDAESTVTSGVLLLSGEYHRFGRFGTRASGSVTWYPVLSGPSRHRVEVRASLRQKMGSDFTVTVAPYYSYDSRPPDSGAPTEDWGWITSLGWTF